jgi:hypothetical protein
MRIGLLGVIVLLALPACPGPDKLRPECSLFLATSAVDKDKQSVALCMTVPQPIHKVDSAHLRISTALGDKADPGRYEVIFDERVDDLPWTSPSKVLDASAKTRIRVRLEADLDGRPFVGVVGRKLKKDFGLDQLKLIPMPTGHDVTEDDFEAFAPQPKLGGLVGGINTRISFGSEAGGQVPVTFSQYKITAITSSQNRITTMRVWWTLSDPSDLECLDGSGYFLKAVVNKTLAQLHTTPFQGLASTDSVPANTDLWILAIIEEENDSSHYHWYFAKAVHSTPNSTVEAPMDELGSASCDAWPP